MTTSDTTPTPFNEAAARTLLALRDERAIACGYADREVVGCLRAALVEAERLRAELAGANRTIDLLISGGEVHCPACIGGGLTVQHTCLRFGHLRPCRPNDGASNAE